MKTALVIPIYNRPAYVRKCFDSLRKLTVKPDAIIIIDDHSAETLPDLRIGVDEWTLHRNLQNEGVKKSLLKGIDFAFQDHNCDLIINLDSDAIVRPDFIERLTNLHYSLGGKAIISGFNNPNEPVLITKDGYVTKAHANGINMCFNRAQYEAYIKPALLSKGNWDYNTTGNGTKFAITIPSCVQHIGLHSSMGHTNAAVLGDIAHDFPILSLPTVTLFGIDSHDKAGIERAANISKAFVEFGAVNIITEDLFTKGGSHDQRRNDYSKFMLKELAAQFNTSHVLTIHADGYIVRPEAWDDEWLQYDYIGASWGYKDGRNNGNGGFSLRSKKLCKILAEQDIDKQFIHPEDYHIGRTFRPSLEKDFGIKFAPEEVCNKFSIEAYGSHVFPQGNLYSGQFGFHSTHIDVSKSMEYGVPPYLFYQRPKVAQSTKQQVKPYRR